MLETMLNTWNGKDRSVELKPHWHLLIVRFRTLNQSDWYQENFPSMTIESYKPPDRQSYI